MKKEDAINKIIQDGGVCYRPLCFKDNGEKKKCDYNIDRYCGLLKETAEKSEKDIDTKTKISSYIISELLIGDKAAPTPTQEDSRRHSLDRYNKRLIKGMTQEVDGKRKGSVASDRECYLFLKDIEKKLKITLITQINDNIPYFYENKYIYLLVKQLIGDMYASDIFNYVPCSNNFQDKCYKNHLNMIESNIKEIFGCESDTYSKWMKILSPLQHIIYERNYPGIKQGDVWHCKCEELRFFDCSYEIAKNFELYVRVKDKLEFDLGSTREEVVCELEACKSFFNKNGLTEKKLFCDKMLDTLKNIVNEEFDLKV